jgi:hypothetical protein
VGVSLSVEVNTKDGAELIVGKGIACRSGLGQSHLGGDQFLCIDIAQQEEQFGLTVESAAHAVEHGGNVFAHVRPVRTATIKGNLARLGEQAMVTIGHDGHHLGGQLALE